MQGELKMIREKMQKMFGLIMKCLGRLGVG